MRVRASPRALRTSVETTVARVAGLVTETEAPVASMTVMAKRAAVAHSPS